MGMKGGLVAHCATPTQQASLFCEVGVEGRWGAAGPEVLGRGGKKC